MGEQRFNVGIGRWSAHGSGLSRLKKALMEPAIMDIVQLFNAIDWVNARIKLLELL
jgi:hypothetical protein